MYIYPFFSLSLSFVQCRIIETEPERLAKLRANTVAMHRALQKEVSLMGGKGTSDSLVLVGDEASPLKHLFLRDGSDDRVKDDRVLQTICDSMSADSRIAVSVCDSTPLVKKAPKPSIRVTVSSGHTSAQIAHFATSLRSAASKAFSL
jgi:7-keto-8-aminopelargonate synthetase-like enzyme